MAFVISSAEAADGRGRISLYGHEVGSEVTILKEDDSRGDIEIRWEHGIGLGLRACMEIGEVWALLAQLSMALAVFNDEPGIDPVCHECGGRIELLDNGIDRWWVHAVHPADGHDAWPIMPEVVQDSDDNESTLPQWVQHALKHGLPSIAEQTALRKGGTDNEVGDVGIVNEDDTTPTPQPTPVLCGVCGGRIELIETVFDRWWKHVVHPRDDHDGVPIKGIDRSENKGA